MNFALLTHEYLVAGLGLAVLLADLWLAPAARRQLGYAAAAGLALILLYSCLAVRIGSGEAACAFNGMYVLDGLALFFKRFFLIAAIGVLLMIADFAAELEAGVSEFYALTLFALTGMLFAASVNHFALLYVSLELITVSFYVLNSFQRRRAASLEAGVKYLVMGALSSGFTIFGIAFVYGVANQLNFVELGRVAGPLAGNSLFLIGLFCVVAGIGFKISAVPFQLWTPDVYEGAPTPATAFLAVGSKAAGFVLLLRLLFVAAPEVTVKYADLLILASAAGILYGNLCALPQRNLKRLLGYSSIAHAGYLLLGVSALSAEGQAAVLYYLAGYLFTLLAAFMVIGLVLRRIEGEDISFLAGLNQRSPLLAASLTLAMVSLAGLPPLAGFFGKFLLLKAVLARGAAHPAYYVLALVAIVGVVISLYYYLGVVRAIYWSREIPDHSPLRVPAPTRLAMYGCLVAMFVIGVYPAPLLRLASHAIHTLQLP